MGITKTPNGTYRAQVFDKFSGKKVSKTFGTKKEAQLWEADWYDDHRGECRPFGEAMKRYIDSKRNILSPTTVKNYEEYEHYYDEFRDLPVDRISDYDLQKFVNNLAKTLQPKTVKNVFSFANSIIRLECPERHVTVSLPKVYQPNLYMPSNAEIDALREKIKGTEWEIPVDLAICGLRRGEIKALTLDDIYDGYVSVNKAVCKKKNGWGIKKPKEEASVRIVAVPRKTTDRIKQQGYVTKLSANMISSKFQFVLKKCGLPRFRFHDLRAYFASAQHALGIPELLTQKAGGWSNPQTMRKIYTRVIPEAEDEAEKIWRKRLEGTL